MKQSRITILDSFRAIAILSVLFFHFFSRWTFPKTDRSLYPYNDSYNYFSYGHLGVEFFFIISGFVIFFTLENTPGFFVFWKKRWIRLAPPIIVASVLTFVIVGLTDTALIFPATHDVKNFFPSISFISPHLLKTITGNASWGYIDGSYWSLWPEVQFYLLSSSLFFLKKDRFVLNFILVSFFLILGNAGVKFLESKPTLEVVPKEFFTVFEALIDKGFNLLNYLPFFSLGVAFYILYKCHNHAIKVDRMIIFFISFLILFILTVHGGLEVSVVIRGSYALMVIIFFLFIYAPQYLRVFESKILRSIGGASYFLYLIHQNIGVTMIFYFGYLFLPYGFVLPLILILVMTGTSILYSERIDKYISKWLRSKIIR